MFAKAVFRNWGEGGGSISDLPACTLFHLSSFEFLEKHKLLEVLAENNL